MTDTQPSAFAAATLTDPNPIINPNPILHSDPELDPLDALLNLEETFYSQGYALGHSDGLLQGRLEGRVFGLERGFDKFHAIARLHGHATVLGNRLPAVAELFSTESKPDVAATERMEQRSRAKGDADVDADAETELELGIGDIAPLAATSRLEKHVRTLYALSEPASLALTNGEDEVSEFDDRYKRAVAKATILGRMVGYEIAGDDDGRFEGGDDDDKPAERGTGKGQEAGIEDVGILKARH